MATSPDWILVPGAWARGPEVYGPLRAALAGTARTLIADLPKDDPAAASPAHYVAALLQQYRAWKATAHETTNPVAVLAHSAGGALLPAALDALAAAGVPVAGVVLVTAFAPVGGRSVLDLRPSMDDAMRAQARARMASLPPEQRALPVPAGEQLDDLYLAHLPADEAERVRAALVPEPFAVLDAPVDYGQVAGRCPIHYVLCEQDRSLPPDNQREMLAGLRAAGCQGEERALPAGHNVILTHPHELARIVSSLFEQSVAPSDAAARGGARRRWWPWRRRKAG